VSPVSIECLCPDWNFSLANGRLSLGRTVNIENFCRLLFERRKFAHLPLLRACRNRHASLNLKNATRCSAFLRYDPPRPRSVLHHRLGRRGVVLLARHARRRAPHAVCYNHPGRCAESRPERPRAALGFLTVRRRAHRACRCSSIHAAVLLAASPCHSESVHYRNLLLDLE
jgi:hypothetical protein